MAASPSRRIPSRCLQIRACVWQFPLTEFSHKWVPGVGIPASLKTLFCRQTRTREKECAAGCAHEFIQSTRYLEIWLRSGSILGTSLSARTNLEDLQENPMRPPGFAIPGWAARANGNFPIALPVTTGHGCSRVGQIHKRMTADSL